MFEKVNPAHPDKLCDRIAGALVDLAYSKAQDPRIAVEVQLGHCLCTVITETSVHLERSEVQEIVYRIIDSRAVIVLYSEHKQDYRLAENQSGGFRCGDNGIFLGMPVTLEQRDLTKLAKAIYKLRPTDGKYLIDREHDRTIVCQSNISTEELSDLCPDAEVNPLGEWTGGTDVDTGAVNRKLGSDMGDSVTGGGLHGKDLSKADVSVNIYAWLKAQRTQHRVKLSCAIGDDTVDGKPYGEIVEIAREYIRSRGGFERFAEWGLIS